MSIENPRQEAGEPRWQCARCGADRWIGWRAGPEHEGYPRKAQCVSCGHVQELPADTPPSRTRRRPTVADHEFTPDQIEHGIACAVAERNFDVIPSLLKLLAIQDPRRAQNALDALRGRITIEVGRG